MTEEVRPAGGTPTPEAPPMRSRSRATVVAVVAVFVVVLVVTLVARRPAPPPDTPGGYTERERAAFAQACVAGGGASMAGTCRCAWDELVRTVPPEEYRRLDRAAAATVPPGTPSSGTGPPGTGSVADVVAAVPPEVLPIVTDCLAREVLVPAATKDVP